LLVIGAAPVHAQTKTPGSVASPAPAASSGAESAAPAVAVDANFQIGLGDSLVLELVGRKDFDTNAQVSGEGTILVPLVGKIKALGLTTEQLSQAVQDALKKGGYYSDPLVRVSVTGVASRYATVLGDVTTPGLLPLDRAYHLSDIVAKIGAHFNEGSGTVIVTHENGEQAHYNIATIATGAAAGDPLVQPGDKIYVPPAAQETIYCNGQVRTPGGFPLTKNMTIRDLIARCGGVTDMGSDRKLKLFRKNLLVKDVKLDTQLESGDILQIGERLF
jgi:polysaccharide export outer membrane protein